MAGANGQKGQKGDTGGIGPAGSKGNKGNSGAAGAAGPAGAVGATGPKGASGAVGAAGAQGVAVSWKLFFFSPQLHDFHSQIINVFVSSRTNLFLLFFPGLKGSKRRLRCSGSPRITRKCW